MKSPRIFRVDLLTQVAGELQWPVGPTSHVIFKVHSGICSVCLVRSVSPNTMLNTPFFSPFQWLSTSPFVVTGPDLLTIAADFQELAHKLSQIRPTMIVRLLPLPFTLIIAYSNPPRRCCDQDQQHLRLPEKLGFLRYFYLNGVRISMERHTRRATRFCHWRKGHSFN